jgi:type IV pilus assembly protein PilQ
MPQIEISSKIVEADENFSRKLGVSWVSQENGRADYVMMGFSPAAGFDPTMQLKSVIGSAGALGKLNTMLSMAENQNQINVVSNPKVTVQNSKEAIIVQGKKVPYYTAKEDQNGNLKSMVEYVSAALQLKVTPFAASDGSILLNLNIEKNVPAPTAPGLPPELDVKSSITEVLVNNGETLVLGGIYEDRSENNVTGVPVLKDIPLLGWLFRGKSRLEGKRELLIFVTPKIIDSTVL